MKKRYVLNFIAMVLILTFVINFVPVNAIEYIVDSISQDEQTVLIDDTESSNEEPPVTEGEVIEPEKMDTTSPAKVLNEATEYRAANIKTFRMSDGTYQSVMYSRPVHYQDEDTWKEIDNTLSSSDANSTFSTKNMPYTVTFVAKTNGNKLVTYDTGDISVSLTPSYIKNGKAKKLSSKIDKSNVVVSDNYAFYGDVYENADLEYTVEAYRIKENIIVNSPADSYQYGFILNVDKKEAEVKLEDGVINIYKTGEEQPSLYIAAPVMTDNNGIKSNLVTLSLEQETKGEYIVTVTADTEWMNDNTRSFPVRIDPTIEDIMETSWGSYCAWDGEMGFDYILIDDGVRSYFNYALPTIPSNARILSSTIQFEMNDFYVTDGNTAISAYQLGTAWTTAGVMNGTEPTITTILDQIIFTDQEVQTVAPFVSLNITKAVKAWYEDPTLNYGIKLITSITTGLAEECQIIDSTSDFRILTCFMLPNGLNNKWSTHAISTDERAGTAYIKDINGELIYVHPDLSTTGNLLPVSISHIYNKNFSGHSNYYGRGWTLNVLQTMKPVSIELNEYDLTEYYYLHTDATGNKTYYYRESYASNIYINENDPLIEYNASTRTIEYPDGSDIVFNTDGYIYQVYDYTTNSLQTYTYSAAGKIESITDGAGKVVEFEYNNSGYLSRIYLAAMESREIVFEYSTYGYLNKITYADGTYTAFTNSTANWLYSARFYSDASTYNRVNLEFTDGKVTKATALYASPSSATIYKSVLTFIYGDTTKVIYSDSATAQDNDYYETIYFDTAGRTTGIIDSEGYFSYGQYASGDLAPFDVIERHTTSKVAVENLISDGDIQIEDISWDMYDYAVGIINAEGYSYYVQRPELGEYGLAVYNETIEIDNSFAIHDINAQAGQTYTISAVLAYNDFNSETDGAVLGFKYIDASGNEQLVYGEPNYSGNYERLAYTFTFPEGSSSFAALLGIVGGEIYGMYDLIQVEEGASANEYNFVRNSTFINGTSEWTASGTTAGMSSSDGYKTVYMYGSLYGDALYSQDIYLELEEGTLLSVGGWGKSRASSNGLFGIRVTFNDTATGNSEETDILFDVNVWDWQYVNEIIPVLIDCDKITVSYLFSKNNMGAHFRGMSLELVNLFDETSDGSINEYNIFAQLTKSTYYDGSMYEYEYDIDNDYVSEETFYDTNGNNVVTTYTYDDQNNLKETLTTYYYCIEDEVYEMSSRTINTYDTVNDNGNILNTATFVRDFEGTTSQILYTKYLYSDNGNVCIMSTDERGKETDYEYNDIDELTRVTSPEGVVTTYTYDPAGRLIMTSQGEDSTDSKEIGYTYASGRLSEITHNGFDYFFGYNRNSDVINIKIGNLTTKYTLASYEYNGAFGQVSKMTYGNNQYKNYVYDDYGRLLYVTYYQSTPTESNTSYVWTYDDRGQVVSVKANNVTTEYSYDSMGRVKTITDSRGNSIWRRYYSKENKSEYSYLSSGKDAYTSFVYETIPEQLQNKTTVTSGNDALVEITDQGDCFGRIETQTTKINDTSSYEIGYSYNSFPFMYNSATLGLNETAEISEITYNKYVGSTESELLPKLSYTYYEDGNIKEIKENDVLKVTYFYDEFDQLIRENNKYLNNGSGYTITYSYDDGGNMLEKKIYSYTDATSVTNLTPIDTITYGYDSVWKDMMTSIDGETITRDAIGNPTSYPGVASSILWTQGNKISSIYYPADSDWIYLNFAYNENGLRTHKNAYKNISRNIEYFWFNNVLQSEYSTDGYEIVYCYAANGSLIGFTYETATARVFYRYVLNAQGDVIALLDENYNVVVKYTYDTWGKVLSVTNASGTLITDTTHIGHRNPIRYRGYYYDVETGLYYLQSRYYDPEVGRFISADGIMAGIGGNDNGYNLFAYCFNNPVNYADLKGTWPGLITTLAIAFGVHVLCNKPKVKNNQENDKKNDFIKDQDASELDGYYYGYYPIDYNGCGPIAVYNALLLKDKDNISLTDVINKFYECDGERLCGLFGTKPKAIGDVLSAYGIEYSLVDIKYATEQPGVYIVSYWCENPPWNGAHNVAMSNNGATYSVFNGKEGVSPMVFAGDRTIMVYYLGSRDDK